MAIVAHAHSDPMLNMLSTYTELWVRHGGVVVSFDGGMEVAGSVPCVLIFVPLFP
jgi:hypothetical protein